MIRKYILMKNILSKNIKIKQMKLILKESGLEKLELILFFLEKNIKKNIKNLKKRNLKNLFNKSIEETLKNLKE